MLTVKIAVVALVVALTALAAFGAGWKWRHSASGSAQHVAGWTWDAKPSHHQH